MDLVAIGATNLVRGMPSRHPVAHASVLYVAAQASAVRLRRAPLTVRNDLGHISATFHVQTARAVALLALDTLLCVESMAKVFSHIFMTRRADIGSFGFRARNLYVVGKRSHREFGIPGRSGRKGIDSHDSKNRDPPETGATPHKASLNVLKMKVARALVQGRVGKPNLVQRANL